jgi:hypothetical protein
MKDDESESQIIKTEEEYAKIRKIRTLGKRLNNNDSDWQIIPNFAAGKKIPE